MYLQVLDAILTEFDKGKVKGKAKWAKAEGIYTMVTELLRYAQDTPGMFGSVENVKIRTEYALVLAHLNRFSEAHRRLDEALGYLAMIPGQTNSALSAEITVRRAEVSLLEAKHIQKQKGKQLQALILDCFDSIERAERILITYGKATWWRSKLSVIQLQAFACLAKLNKKNQKGLPRPLIDKLDRWSDTYKLGIQLAEKDPLRTTYLCEFGLQLLNKKKKGLKQNEIRDLDKQMRSQLEFIKSAKLDYRLEDHIEKIYARYCKKSSKTLE